MRQWCTILERADRIVRPNMVLDTFVGADAYIGPLGTDEFATDFR